MLKCGRVFFFLSRCWCLCHVRHILWCLFSLSLSLLIGNTAHILATQNHARWNKSALSFSKVLGLTLFHHGLSSQIFPHLIKLLTNAPTNAHTPSPVDLCSSFSCLT